MEVYVIQHLLICDFDIITNESKVYKNPIKAKKAFKALVNKEHSECQEYNWEVETDDENAFEAGVSGSWAEFSVRISLNKQELL